MAVEPERIQKLNDAPERPDRKFVLYWSQMNRRVDSNHALLFAAEVANRHNLPLLVYEGLTCTYEYANDRLHTFVLEAVPGTAAKLQKFGIGYLFYLRQTKSARNDVLYELAQSACAVVTDDYPTFIARTHNQRVPKKIDTAYYVVDASCVVPMSCIAERQYAAYTMRPKITRLLPRFFKPAGTLHVNRRFDAKLPQFHTAVTKEKIPALVASCDIDHSVAPSSVFKGGYDEAEKRLHSFLEQNLRRFADDRNHPTEHATSGLSPYLHFGQISSLEIALAVRGYASTQRFSPEAYLEELIVRRELSFNYCRHVEDPGDLNNLPDWCRENMKKHAGDKRDPVYTAKQLERAEIYDDLWNATQKEMLLRGKINGYYRMYWGKKIIEWSQTYSGAAKAMIDIHGRYALDGRDPNTYTNVLWCFGLHDRPWPERPIFGKMRYMSLEGMKRKTDTGAYIDEIRNLEASGRERV